MGSRNTLKYVFMKPSELYDGYYARGDDTDFDSEERLLLRLIEQEPRGRLLDIGCGSGRTGAELRKLGFDVAGVDHSAEAIKLAKVRGIVAQMADLDGDGLPFDDCEFDLAWAGDVLEHVFDPIFMLTETNRVLKVAGKIYLNVPNEFPLRTRLAILLKSRACQSFTYRTVGVDHHHTHFSLELLEFMLEKAGFEMVWRGSMVRWPLRFIPGEWLSQSRFLGKEFGRNVFVVAKKKS
jgi:SAM-dependent methyltransferase